MKDYKDQIWGINLLQKLLGGILKFSVHLPVIFMREFSVTIRDRYKEKLKTLLRSVYPRLVPKNWSAQPYTLYLQFAIYICFRTSI